MNKLFIGAAVLTLIVSLLSYSDITQTEEFDKMLEIMKSQTGGKSYPTIIHKSNMLDKAAATQNANIIFKFNPVALRTASPFKDSENDEEYIFKSGSIEYRLSKTNGEMLIDLARYGIAEKSDVIDSNNAKQIAFSYITKYLSDIPQNEIKYLKTNCIILSGGAGDGKGNVKGKIQEDVANYIVIFSREVDDLPVIGPGGKIRVYLARNGDVVGHSKLWCQFKAERRNPKKVISPNDAQKSISIKIMKENYFLRSVVLKSIKFGYFEHGRNKAQNASIPVYEFIYKLDPQSPLSIEYIDGFTGNPISGDDKPVQSDSR
jgi:hypothetical protein